jgi:hypothetical protein
MKISNTIIKYNKLYWSFLLLIASIMIWPLQTRAQTANQYSFTATTQTFTPLVSPTNSSLAATADDNMSSTISLGFTFNFENIPYTNCRVSSNGQLILGGSGTASGGNNLATTSSTERPGVAPLWDDIQCTAGVKYLTTGSAPNRVFTAEWLNMEWNYSSTTAVLSFQVKLYEGTDVIEINYRQEATAVNTASGGASIGIMGVSSNDYISIQDVTTNTISTSTSQNGIVTKPATNALYRFTPPPACSGTPPGGLTSLTATPGCGTGNFSLAVAAAYERGTQYIWQSSPDGISWTNLLIGDTLSGYTAAPITTPTYYRRNTTCISTTLVGSSSAILVKPVYAGISQSTAAVCGDSITLSVTNRSAGISTFQWLESSDSLVWTPIFNATSATQKVISPLAKTYYRVYVTCSATSSFDTSIAVTVNPVKAGTTNISASVCMDSTTLNLTGSSSGSSLTFNWLQSTDSINWTPMGITTAAAKFPSPLSAMFYKSVVTCGLSSDSSVARKVAEPCQGFKYNVVRNAASAFTSIQSTGTLFNWRETDGDDNSTLPVLFPSGFNFTYNGTVIPAFYACTNGWLTLDTVTAYSVAWTNDLTTTSPKYILAPFWEDLVTLGNSFATCNNIKYQLQGTAPNRVMVVEWAEMERYQYGAPSLNFQVKFYEGSNNIEYVYGKMQPFDGTGTGDFNYSIGMTGNNPAGGQKLSLLVPNTANFSNTLVNNALTQTPLCNTSYLFTAGGTFSPTNTSSIPSNDSSGAPIILTVNPTPCTDACGTYYTSLNATASGTAISPVSGNPDDDVWFQFVAPLSSQVNISLISSSGYDPAFQVMTASFDTTGLGAAGSRNASSSALESVVATGLVAGNPYLIRIFNAGTGAGSTSGAFALCVNEIIPPPINDDTAGAIVLTPKTTCTPTAGTTLAATASVQAVCGGIADDDVWYKFSPKAYTDTINVTGTGTFRAHVQVLTQSMVSLSCLNTTVNGGTVNAVVSGLSLDSVYFIRVYHTNAGTAGANFSICITGDSATTPVVKTLTPSNLYNTIVNLSGNITSNGGFPVTKSGIVVGFSANPVIGGSDVDSTTSPVVTSGAFSKIIDGLTPSTLYHYRAYAQNVLGIAYGPDSTFTTAANPSPAGLTVIAATNVQATTATVGGTIVINGGSTVTSSGVIYSTTPNPTLGSPGVIDTVTNPAVISGPFTLAISGLTHSSKYYYRAYAINGAGAGYSTQDSFTTGILITALPYSQNFEGGKAGWSDVATGGGNNWILGTPAKVVLTGAHSGTKAWVTKLVDNYDDNHNAAIVSPQIDLTTATNPVIRFYHKFSVEANYDAMVLEISINNGAWTKLDATQGTGTNYNTPNSYAWYNTVSANGGTVVAAPKFTSTSSYSAPTDYVSNNNGWLESATYLTGAAGQNNVKVRFRYGSDGSGNGEGWAIDDIEIVDVAAAPTTPASAVNLTNVNGTTTKVNWTNGNGTGRLVVARLTSTPAVAPADNYLYTPNTTFGAQDSTGLGNYVIYSNNAATVVATGLTNFTDYTYDVYEYNGKYMHIKFTSPSSNNATTLPVKLNSFTGVTKASDVLLDWNTASEINNKGFEIERSVDGRNFSSVNFVKGAGNSSRSISYSFIDAKAFDKAGSSALYYRLKQVDFDGSFNYSPILRVTKTATEMTALTVYPNPYANDFTISFAANNAGNAQVEIVDIQGKTVAHTSSIVVNGNNVIPMTETAYLQLGVYFVRLTINGDIQVIKLVKN